MSHSGNRDTKRANASVSLDLDNMWSYLRTHGDESWQQYPSYLTLVVPRILNMLEDEQLTISFFVVGLDASKSENGDALRAIAEQGHEIGNHSFRHEPWLHLYSKNDFEQEIELAEVSIEAATGKLPVGFRGPGFSLSTVVLEVLADRGYEYDATVFPNILNPLSRAYFFATSDLTKEERKQRSALFGSMRDAFSPVGPYWWRIGERRLLEIPVTTMPVFRVPIHLSYLLFLCRFSDRLAWMYFQMALKLCRISKTEPSLLLHPLDFLTEKDAPEVAFFPGMTIPLEQKLDFVRRVLAELKERYEVLSIIEHVKRMKRKGIERERKPVWDSGERAH